jgi:ribosomal protein L11 methyltransferase
MSSIGELNPYAVGLVKNLSREHEDAVTAILFEFGAEGVSEELPFVQNDLRYDPEVVDTRDVVLKAYFSDPLSEAVRFELETALREVESRVQFSMTLEEHRDWLEEWKKGFVPFLFAEPFWVVPKWCSAPQHVAKTHVIWMDPGMAFGTGTHETTRLAASLIVPWMNEQRQRHGQELTRIRVLDVGTGTGILALITERMGAGFAMGLDIDSEARRTARENLQLNLSTKTKIDDRDLSDIAKLSLIPSEAFDLTIANIIDGVLLALAPDLAATVRPGGTLILSGILTDREDPFHHAFAKATGLSEQRRVREGEWCASIWVKAV